MVYAEVQMPAGTRHTIIRRALIGSIALISAAMSIGTVQAANSPSPRATASSSATASPSASPSPSASVSASASASGDVASAGATATASGQSGSDSSDLGGVDDSGAAVQDTAADQLTVGIDRWITYTSTATAVGGNGLASATLPMPKGLVPIRVRGRLVSIADSGGVVRIRVGTDYVEVDAEKGGLFTLTVPPDAVVEQNLTIEVRNTLAPGAGKCEGDYTTTETISELEVGFIGRETPPTTIAGFFSPPVQKVTLVAPDVTDLDIAEATLAAAGALSMRYNRDVPIIISSSTEFAADPTGLVDSDGPNRIVRISPDESGVVRVSVSNPGVPTLTISGPSAQLAGAAAALASSGLGLAAVPIATALSEERFAQTAETLTLAELGAERPTLSGLGRLVYSIGVRQDLFGGPINSVAIHFEGAYTPVPAGGQANVSILWNDQLVESQLLDATGAYAADVTVEGPLVRRDNALSIRVDAVPPGGDCGQATQPMQLDLNGFASTVTGRAGQTLAAGFARFPQAFGSTTHVAFGSGPLTTALVQAACSLAISLQRASSHQLEFITDDFASFLAAPYPGIVVGATPRDADALAAPLRFEPWRAVNSASTDFSVSVDGPFAALEGFELEGRNILMLGGTAPAATSQPLVTQLADEAEDREFGWFGLRDNLLVAQPGAEPLTLSSASLVPQASVKDDARTLPPWWIILAALIVVTLTTRWWMLRRRSHRVAVAIAEKDAATTGTGQVPTADGSP